MFLSISPETVLRAHVLHYRIARATTTAAVPRPLIPSNDRQAAAAVAVADEEMDKSNELSVPSRRGMESDMSHIFCATGAACPRLSHPQPGDHHQVMFMVSLVNSC